MKKILLLMVASIFLSSCGGGSDDYEGEPADHAGHGIWKFEIIKDS
ncbi:hypothetical protein N9C34_03940 [Candidatus Marinimicrobia bacterium]|nr:hypothetical protein [Candidatus Neomarinimicrobiota bacterium]